MGIWINSQNKAVILRIYEKRNKRHLAESPEADMRHENQTLQCFKCYLSHLPPLCGPAPGTQACDCVVLRSLSHVWLLRDPMHCSPPGFSLCGISQARILEWVAISFSRGSSQPRDQTLISYVSCTAGGFFTHWAVREALLYIQTTFFFLTHSSKLTDTWVASTFWLLWIMLLWT